MVDHSKLLAEQLGYPQLAADPGFYRMTYLAGRALNGGAGAGGQAADNAAPLEGAGGASPGGAGQGAAPTAEQVTAGWKNQRVPFMSGSW